MREVLEVHVERAARPMLWLDTSVLIHAVRGDLKPGAADDRITELLSLVGEQVGAGKLLCVESDHRREVEGHARALLVLRKLREQTLGVRMRNRSGRQSFQTFAAMEAYLAGSDSLTLGVRDFFDRDPCEETDAVRTRGWRVSAESVLPEEARQLAETGKRRTLAGLEAIRTKNRATGKGRVEQLVVEQTAYFPTMFGYLGQLAAEFLKPEPDLLMLAAGCPLVRHLHSWWRLGGERERFESFFTSAHFLAVPDNAIVHQLFADLLTGDQPVKPGDPMDIEHMSAALPTCTWVLTDKAMRHRVQRLGLDREWGAEVYALRNVDSLMTELKAL